MVARQPRGSGFHRDGCVLTSLIRIQDHALVTPLLQRHIQRAQHQLLGAVASNSRYVMTAWKVRQPSVAGGRSMNKNDEAAVRCATGAPHYGRYCSAISVWSLAGSTSRLPEVISSAFYSQRYAAVHRYPLRKPTKNSENADFRKSRKDPIYGLTV